MSEDMIERAATDAVQGSRSGRRIDLRLVAWGDTATKTDEGYPEQILPGAFAGVDPSRVTLESQRHGGALAGVGEEIIERSDGAYGTFRVADTPAGDELLALTRPGPNGEPAVLRDASVVFAPVAGKSRTTPEGVVQRLAVDLRRVAIVERGAYASGAVLAVRSEREMTTEQTAEAVEPAGESVPVETVARAAPDPELVARMESLDERIAKLASIATVPSVSEPSGIAEHPTLADYTSAVYTGKADPGLLARSLAELEVRRSAADQITTNNAGVVPPAWLRDVKRIVDLGRRAITAWGGPTALPDTGMEVDWPYLTSDNTLIGVQSTQKTEVTSARVDIAKGSANVVTYAGYSDIAYQLLQRSSPSYREAYDRILLAAWGSVCDAAFVAALEGASGTTTQTAGAMLGDNKTLSTSAAADDIIDATGHGLSNGDACVFTALTGGTGLTAGRVYWVIADNLTADDFQVAEVPGGDAVDFTADITGGTVAKVTDTGAKFRAALAQASVSIEDATGQPAGIVLTGTDMFLMLAGLSGFVANEPSGNPSNADGTMLASSLRMESSGLLIQRAPGVSDGKVLVSNRMTAAWHEDGPRFVTAEDVAKLGQNVGVYSFAAPAVYVPAGVVELTLI